MKIWLDDVRTPPDTTWTWCTNGYECIWFIIANRKNIEIVSFDHDLGEGVDGYWVACQIESMANNYYQASLDDFKFENRMGIILPPFDWELHSANPVGRRNIEMAMRNAEKYWSKS